MNILPQNYTFLLNKILKDSFKNSFNISTIDNYVDMITKIEFASFAVIRQALITYFESIDKSFKESTGRKKYYYTKGKKRRYLITIFGEISFEREYYVSKNNSKNGFFYVDKVFSFMKNDTYDPIVKALLMDYKAHSTYQKAADDVSKLISIRNDKKISIPRQTVFNVLKKFNISDIDYNSISKPIKTDKLYILLDEKYVHLQDTDKDDIMVKHAVIYTGKTKVSKKRNKLDNKVIFSSIEGVEDTANKINEIIYNQFRDYKHIIVSGDGANWIKSVYNCITTGPKIKKNFVLDEFHFTLAVNSITQDEDLKQIIYDYIYGNNKQDFNTLIDVIIDNNPDRKENIENYRQYINNNWKYILNIKKDYFIGCPMEGHISNDLAKVFTRDPKAYKLKNIPKHIKLRDLQLNSFDIFKVYLNKNDYIITPKDINYYNTNHSSNILLFEGKTTETSKAFEKIAHGIDTMFI